MVRQSVGDFLWSCEAILRKGPETLKTLSPYRFVAILIVFGGIYGSAMGSFGGGGDPRFLQMLCSAVKVPMLFGVTFLLSIPTFFVFMTLMGLRDDVSESLRALMATQASVAIVLASFAPFTLLWYSSTNEYNQSVLFNGAMFGVASLSGQRVLARLYRPLILRDGRHRSMMVVWLVIFAFVGIQMGWVLRPFVGDPTEPTTFFRGDAWGNAYEAVAKHVRLSFGL